MTTSCTQDWPFLPDPACSSPPFCCYNIGDRYCCEISESLKQAIRHNVFPFMGFVFLVSVLLMLLVLLCFYCCRSKTKNNTRAPSSSYLPPLQDEERDEQTVMVSNPRMQQNPRVNRLQGRHHELQHCPSAPDIFALPGTPPPYSAHRQDRLLYRCNSAVDRMSPPQYSQPSTPTTPTGFNPYDVQPPFNPYDEFNFTEESSPFMPQSPQHR